jgi:hypothetical protein
MEDNENMCRGKYKQEQGSHLLRRDVVFHEIILERVNPSTSGMGIEM